MAAIKDWIRGALSDNGNPSSSRGLTVVHSAVACIGFLWVVFKTGHLPSVDESSGLGLFATVHYGVNRVTQAWGKKENVAPAATDPNAK